MKESVILINAVMCALMLMFGPNDASANDQLIASMNKKCVVEALAFAVDGRSFFENLKSSKKAFDDGMRQFEATEDELNSFIKLYTGGADKIQDYCDCLAKLIDNRLPERGHQLAKQVMAGEGLNSDEQKEYIQAAKTAAPSSLHELSKCMN